MLSYDDNPYVVLVSRNLYRVVLGENSNPPPPVLPNITPSVTYELRAYEEMIPQSPFDGHVLH